jgi:pimeloyl-ACP methyl ester carboxylesterase
VLLHGFAVGAAMWMGPPPAGTAILPALASDYRVIALDRRGHGASGKPHDPAPYGDEMVRDVIRLLDHLEIGKAHLVGYSMGAVIAGKLLVTHPDRLLSVTFGGGGPMVGPPTALEETLDATADSLASGKGARPLVMSFTPPGQPTPSQVAPIPVLFMFARQDNMVPGPQWGGLEGNDVDVMTPEIAHWEANSKWRLSVYRLPVEMA